MNTHQLPIPAFFAPTKVSDIWRVPYQQLAVEAASWAQKYNITPASKDQIRVGLLLIDVQNTFCIPGFELFVGGRSGTGAVEDNARLCEFIYRNLGVINAIAATMDTHTAMQIFHPVFWINEAGEHPAPATLITRAEVPNIWKVNPAVAASISNGDVQALQNHALHYVNQLTHHGKYPLTVWPYHAMLGGIGNALVSAVEEAVFFHTIARKTQARFEIKGNNPLTENYSVLHPEVLTGADDKAIAQKNTKLIQYLLDFDKLIIAGQAKSHCVAWTIDDLLAEIKAVDSSLAQKIYLLEDCTSPVVIPDVVDYTEQAEAAFERFANAGMHLIKSSQMMNSLV